MSETLNKQKSIFNRKRLWLALLYVSLLIWSGIYRYNTPDEPISKTKQAVQLNAFDGDKNLERKIRFAYKEVLPKSKNDDLPVILIHGSPGSAEVFDGLSKIVEGRRLISVDLPGFGNSAQDIPDYSIYAHAKYLQEFLKQKNIEKAHFASFSLGGGVILHLAEMSPEKIASVSFIASIGVQEYELLGDYHANHFIHGVQLTFCWVLQELTPHFGIFDGVPMAYSRNFYDTDQRPLRSILRNIEKPFLIIHGEDDPLVPVEAAREHKRIIPQSEYHELNDNHFFIFQKPEKIDGLLETFWINVESGKAKTRSNADANRTAEANKPFEYKVLKATGATVFVFFLLLAVIAFINKDFAFLIAGILVFQGRFGITFATIACLFGFISSILFWLLIHKFKILENFLSKVVFWNRIPLNYKKNNLLIRKRSSLQFLPYIKLEKFFDVYFSPLVSVVIYSIIWIFSLMFISYFVSWALAGLDLINAQNTLVLILIILTIYTLFLTFFYLLYFKSKKKLSNNHLDTR